MKSSLVVNLARLVAMGSAFLVSVRLIGLSLSKSLPSRTTDGQVKSKPGPLLWKATAGELADPHSPHPGRIDVSGAGNPATAVGVTASVGRSSEVVQDAPSSIDPSVPPRTLAYFGSPFYSGFRNEGIAFTWFIMYAVQNNFSQVLLESINWKDLWLFEPKRKKGEKRIAPAHAPHAVLFDIEHWNSYYPRLPRLVHYNPVEHYEFNHTRRKFRDPKTAQAKATRPYAYGRQSECFGKYKEYTRRVVNNSSLSRDPSEVLMLQGAFRPSRELVRLMDALHDGEPYLTLHARVEPDMQKHVVPRCSQFKVLRLTEIVAQLEQAFPDPPVRRVHVSVFRALLEHEATTNPNNTIALENLNELNRISRDGLWNGTVKVFEAGTDYILKTNHSRFVKYASIAGAVVNYVLSLQSQIFVGTEVSSFSLDVVQSRFFRGNFRNHFYRPEGILLVTTPDALHPPRFWC